MRRSTWPTHRSFLACVFTTALLAGAILPGVAMGQESKTITQILAQPLPPEALSCQATEKQVVVTGPTFTYTIDRGNGAITGLEVRREDKAVLQLKEADFAIDEYRLAAATGGKTEIVREGKDQVVVKTEGQLKAADAAQPAIAYTLTTTFFNDGVVVAEMKLVPAADVTVKKEMTHRLLVDGRLQHYLHKRRNSDFPDKMEPPPVLPKPGETVLLGGLTSCLQAFSHEAALAIFTDVGLTHYAGNPTKAASLETLPSDGENTRLRMAQQIVDVGQDGEGYVLKGGEEFKLRYGISVAPNRLPHPRWRDLRMFIWVGDGKNPYPTDEEISQAAQLGFTLFQMHRVGTPGEPRPPAGELERVIEKVHASGMLFLWTANADLMYASAPGVVDLVKRNQWVRWQGFNYGGRYTAEMDPYCDTLATCLASPNGLADYRVKTIHNMMQRFKVDGMYIDDNLAYGNCTLWKEHGHPRPVYDCLIELHEMGWRRRQALHEHCPHVVLVDHCSKALLLPVICDFDVHLFGEGYSFPSVQVYWDLMGSMENMYAQGSLFAGDSESARCSAAMAYNFDLLTGGGQYTYLDWRLWPQKFPYASGVEKEEWLYVRNYNLAQYYFGLYESKPYYFARSADVFSTTAPDTYVTLYHNQTWGDSLIPVVNMSKEPRQTTLAIPGLAKLGLPADATYLLYDVNARTCQTVPGKTLAEGVGQIAVPAQGLRLFCLRQMPENAVTHLWGGKRISQALDAASGNVSVKLVAPSGVEETVVFGGSTKTVREVRVDGKPAEFFRDPASGLVHGKVTFASEPANVEVVVSGDGQATLPENLLTPDELAQYLKIGR